jgi:anti-sigma factor RsiW
MDDRELLFRYREGDLPAAEMERVRERLRSDPELQARLERLEKLAVALQEGAVRSFEPFFATRVMARVRQTESGAGVEGMYEAMRWLFARVAVAAVVVMLGIGTYSALGDSYGGSVIDDVLGLPEATLTTALTLAD